MALATGFKGQILFLMYAGTSNWSYHIKKLFYPRNCALLFPIWSFAFFVCLFWLVFFKFILRCLNWGRNIVLSLTFLIHSASMATISRLFLSSSRSANLCSKDSLSFCNSLHSSLACFAWHLMLSRYCCNPMIILSKSRFSASFVAIWPAEMQNKIEIVKTPHSFTKQKNLPFLSLSDFHLLEYVVKGTQPENACAVFQRLQGPVLPY